MSVRGIFASYGSLVGDRRTNDFAGRVLMNGFGGSAPMLALSAGMPKERVRNTEFSWVEDSHISGNAEATESIIASATELDVDDVNIWVPNSIVLNQDTGEQMFVTGISGNTITIVRGFAGTTAAGVTSGDKIQLISTAFAEGSTGAESVMQVGESRTNYVQIYKAKYGVTGTTTAVEYQLGAKMAESKSQAMMYLSESMERSFMFGRPSVSVVGGKQLRTTAGIQYSIETYGGLVESANDNGTAGRLNLNSLNSFFRKIFDRNIKGFPNERIAFTSSHVIELIQQMVLDVGDYGIRQGETSFGLKVTELVVPNGTVKMLTHPLFIENDAWSQQLWVLHPAGMRRKVLRDVAVFDKNQKQLADAKDAEEGHILTELGWEVKGVKTMGIFKAIETAGGIGDLPTA